MTTALFLFCSTFRYRKRTAFCGVLLCFCIFWAEHHHLDTRFFSRTVAGEAQGITLIAAAGTPECAGEPKALCITSNDHAAMVWQQWGVFTEFSALRPDRVMPGSERYDLIFIDRLSAGQSIRPAVILNRLLPGGVLAVPVELAARWPQLNWQTLPGSNGTFAAARPDVPQWKLDPAELDAALFRGRNRKNSLALLPGALNGMLVGFHSEKASLPQGKTEKSFEIPGRWAWGILLIFSLLHFAAFHRPKFSEALSIGENCLGFALILTLIFRTLPECFAALPMLMLFFFCYPLKMRNWLLKLAGALAIAVALLWSLAPGAVLATFAVLLTGTEFSTTFREQMAEKPREGRLVAAMGLVLGFLLAALAEHLPFATMQVFQIALLFRIWTLIRC